MKYVCLFACLAISIQLIGQSTIESIPNNKLINNSYVSNPNGILDRGTVSRIDTLLANLESKTAVQVAVVVVESIGDAEVVDFAQKLFNTWGIGNKNNNGLLLLLVKDIHIVRFHTGYGLEGALPDITCKHIQREFMVPEFKRDNYNAGVLAGLQQVEKVLTDPIYKDELMKDAEGVSGLAAFVTFLSVGLGLIIFTAFGIKLNKGQFSDSKHPAQTSYREMRLPMWLWFIEFIILPALIIWYYARQGNDDLVGVLIFVLYLYFILTIFHRIIRGEKVIARLQKDQKYFEVTEFMEAGNVYWFFIALFFPFPFLFYFLRQVYRRNSYRYRDRNCAKCNSKMSKVSETNDDQFLSNPEQMEQKLNSVDYDVWKCSSCENIQRWAYPDRKSKYEPCPKCKTVAYYFISSTTLRAATYSSTGQGEQVKACKYCGVRNRSKFTISQLKRSSSSDDDSSSSSSSSSSDSGSWGGGSSGGGGASSSW